MLQSTHRCSDSSSLAPDQQNDSLTERASLDLKHYSAGTGQRRGVVWATGSETVSAACNTEFEYRFVERNRGLHTRTAETN